MNLSFLLPRRSWLVWLLLFPLTARADGFVDLRSSDYPVDSILPYYTTVVPLGAANLPTACQVRIDYPEFAPLSSTEVKKLEAWGVELPDTLEVTTHQGTVQKQGQLDVAVLPFVIHDGRPSRLTSFKLVVEAVPSARRTFVRSTSERWRASSVLASGRWVKIRVTDEGIYQLTTSQLAEMGFSAPSRVRLYGYGGRIQPETFDFESDDCPPDDLEEVPLYRRDGSLLFFAEGTVRWTLDGTTWTHANNVYSNYSYYFLTESDEAPAQLETLPEVSASVVVDEVTGHALIDNDAYSWFRGGRRFYDSYDFATRGDRTLSLATPDFVSGGTAQVAVNFAAASSRSRTSMSVAVNGSSLGTLTAATLSQYQLANEDSETFTTTNLAEDNVFELAATSGNAARLDYIRVSYPRRLTVSATPYVFTRPTASAVTFRIDGATADTHLWRIGRAGDPTAEVPVQFSEGTLTATVADASRRYIAFNASATYPSPTVVGEVDNQNLHADRNIDMVIIVPASGALTTEAERLAEAHRSVQGLNVKVVRADHIYNEFSSGTPDATAYRRYLKMLYDRADTDSLPRFLLFFGDCLWDNRTVTPDVRDYNPDDYLLAYESDNSVHEINCYVTDDYYGMLDDGEGENILREKMDLAVGRFPCHTADDARILVDKSIAYLRNEQVGSWKNQICFMADDGDSNLHMEDADATISSMGDLADNFAVQHIYWDAYPREASLTGYSYPQVEERIHRLMNSGALVMNYTGHGDPVQLSVEAPVGINDFREARSPNLPLWVTASCEVIPYDDIEDNIGRAGMLNADGGGIAFVCAARTVYSDRNRAFNSAFMRYLMTPAEDGSRCTFGEALMQAKNRLVETSDRTSNRVKFALTGNPALPLGAPTLDAVIDSIDGHALSASDGGNMQLRAGSLVRFSGRVLSSDGQTHEGFNGIVSATVYDREETITCRNNPGDDIEPHQYSERTKVLYEGSDSVRSGRFSFVMRVPVDISYSSAPGRVLLYAVNTDHTQEANGSNSHFFFDGTSDDLSGDTLGPDVYVYLNREDFPDGGRVGTTPTFFAQIADSSGVNTTGNGVGHDLELTLTGPTSGSYVLNDYFSYNLGSATEGVVSYTLPELEEGHYRLQFRAWDILNHPTTKTLNFVVVNGLPPQLSVRATENPARSSTTFVLSFDTPGAEGTFAVDLYDMSGRHVWTQFVTGTMSSAGISIPMGVGGGLDATVGGGVYLYRGRATVAGVTYTTEAEKLIVLKQ